MELPSNPFAVLTFISAPAVLTNASCVLLFGTGNRYGRAIDRVHALVETVEKSVGTDEPELRLRIRQLDAAERRTSLIIRAMTCFYASVASFVASTLVSLIGALLVSIETQSLVIFSFTVAFVAGTLGVFAMITGAIMLIRETRSSFLILRDETKFVTQKIHDRTASLTQGSAISKS